MKILFKNILEKNTGITASNQSINYPVVNLLHQFLKIRYKSSTTSALITVDFDTDQSMDCFFWGFHQLTSLTLVLKNSGGGTLLTVPVSTAPNSQVDSVYFAEQTTVRSIELTVNGASGFFLGGIGAGSCYTMPNFLSTYPIGNLDSTTVISSPDGQTTNNYIKPRRVYNFGYNIINLLEEINEKYISVGIGKPLYIDIESGYQPIYAIIATSLNFEVGKISDTFTLNLLEAR